MRIREFKLSDFNSIYLKNNKKILPPNFENPVYKSLGVDKPDELSKNTKNPINYAIKRYFQKLS